MRAERGGECGPCKAQLGRSSGAPACRPCMPSLPRPSLTYCDHQHCQHHPGERHGCVCLGPVAGPVHERGPPDAHHRPQAAAGVAAAPVLSGARAADVPLRAWDGAQTPCSSSGDCWNRQGASCRREEQLSERRVGGSEALASSTGPAVRQGTIGEWRCVAGGLQARMGEVAALLRSQSSRNMSARPDGCCQSTASTPNTLDQATARSVARSSGRAPPSSTSPPAAAQRSGSASGTCHRYAREPGRHGGQRRERWSWVGVCALPSALPSALPAVPGCPTHALIACGALNATRRVRRPPSSQPNTTPRARRRRRWRRPSRRCRSARASRAGGTAPPDRARRIHGDQESGWNGSGRWLAVEKRAGTAAGRWEGVDRRPPPLATDPCLLSFLLLCCSRQLGLCHRGEPACQGGQGLPGLR